MMGILLSACKTNKKQFANEESYLLPKLSGVYEKVKPAKIDTNFVESTLYIVRIHNQHLRDESWIYMQEQDAKGIPIANSNKYCEIIKSDMGYHLRQYVPKSISNKPVLSDPNTFESLRKEQLRKKSACTLFLRETASGEVTGSTLGKSCTNRFRGSLYSRTEIKITQDTIWLLEQGFDEYDRHVWGPKKQIPKYVRLKIEE
jgi:hypothetical protein